MAWFSRLLDYLERRLGIDLHYLLKNSVWMSVTRVASMLLGVVFAVLFFRYVDVGQYGNYQYILSVSGLLEVFSLQSFNSAVVQSINRGFYSSYRIGLKKKLRWSLLGTPALLAVAGYYLFKGNLSFALVFGALGIIFPLYSTANFWQVLLRAEKQFIFIAKVNLAKDIVLRSLLILAVLLLSGHFIWLVAINVLINFLADAILFIYSWRKYRVQIQNADGPNDNDLISYGFFLEKLNILNVLKGNLDKILLFGLLGPTRMAVYAVAKEVSKQYLAFFQDQEVLLVPKMVRGNDSYVRKHLRRLVAPLTAVAVAVTIIPIVATPHVIPFLFHHKYDEGIIFFQLMFLRTFFTVVNIPLGVYLTVFKKKTAQIAIKVSSSILILGLYLILIPSMGIMGAVVANIVYFTPFVAYYLYVLLPRRGPGSSEVSV